MVSPGLAFTCARMPKLHHDLHVQACKSMLLVHANAHAVEDAFSFAQLGVHLCTYASLGKEARTTGILLGPAQPNLTVSARTSKNGWYAAKRATFKVSKP